MMSDNMTEILTDKADSPAKIKIEELQFSTRTENALIAGRCKDFSRTFKKDRNRS